MTEAAATPPAKFGDYLTRAPQMELAHAAVVAKGP